MLEISDLRIAEMKLAVEQQVNKERALYGPDSALKWAGATAELRKIISSIKEPIGLGGVE